MVFKMLVRQHQYMLQNKYLLELRQIKSYHTMHTDVQLSDIKNFGNPGSRPDNPDGDTSRWLWPVIYLLYTSE